MDGNGGDESWGRGGEEEDVLRVNAGGEGGIGDSEGDRGGEEESDNRGRGESEGEGVEEDGRMEEAKGTKGARGEDDAQ